MGGAAHAAVSDFRNGVGAQHHGGAAHRRSRASRGRRRSTNPATSARACAKAAPGVAAQDQGCGGSPAAVKRRGQTGAADIGRQFQPEKRPVAPRSGPARRRRPPAPARRRALGRAAPRTAAARPHGRAARPAAAARSTRQLVGSSRPAWAARPPRRCRGLTSAIAWPGLPWARTASARRNARAPPGEAGPAARLAHARSATAACMRGGPGEQLPPDPHHRRGGKRAAVARAAGGG